MFSAEPVVAHGAEARRRAGVLGSARDAGLAVTIAAGTAGATLSHGGYGIGSWAPLGVSLLLLAAVLCAAGFRTTRLVLAGSLALVALGLWSATSVLWGGLPWEGWKWLDQSLLAAAALAVGSLCGARRLLVVCSILAGLSVHGAYVVGSLAVGGHAGWFQGRMLEGPVGYHNAQGAVFGAGLALALGLLGVASPAVRAGAAGVAAILAGGLLLTQSRGALAAAAIAAVAVVAARRETATLLRVALVVGATAMLGTRLPSVDAASFDGAGDRQHALRAFALATAAAAVALAALCALELRSRALRRLGVACVVLAAVAAVVAVHPTGAELGSLRDRIATDDPPRPAPGSTRLTALTLNGRKDAWSVALRMVRNAPELGEGAGSFTARWVRERRIPDLYVLQPHSLELELLAELGPVGLAAFACFVLAVSYALVRRGEACAAGAFGALVALLAQSSIDWTWSFAGIVAAVLVAAGAAAGGGPRRAAAGRQVALALAAGAAAALLLVVPYLASRRVAEAADRVASAPTRAWTLLDDARRLNPWSPDALELQGRLAEADGRYRLAASLYERAGKLSRRRWLDEFRAARALRRGGDGRAARRACRWAVAANPTEKRLRRPPCADT